MACCSKDAAAMEKLREVDTIVVDKTGTLTVGRPSVSEIVAREGWSGDDVLAAAASVNQSSEHPPARAITDAALTAGITLTEPEAFEAQPGSGVAATVQGRAVPVATTS